MNWNEMRG